MNTVTLNKIIEEFGHFFRFYDIINIDDFETID